LDLQGRPKLKQSKFNKTKIIQSGEIYMVHEALMPATVYVPPFTVTTPSY
jgi:hypothetical protein